MWSRSKCFISILMLVLLSVGVLGALAVGQVYERSETLYVSGAAWGPPNDWNPFITWSKSNTTGTIGLLYETLFMYDPLNDEFIPFLAESGEWVSDTAYEVTLREGLAWTDGAPLTAEDVAFTMNLGKQYAALWFSPMW